MKEGIKNVGTRRLGEIVGTITQGMVQPVLWSHIISQQMWLPACIGTSQDRANNKSVTVERLIGSYLSYLNY